MSRNSWEIERGLTFLLVYLQKKVFKKTEGPSDAPQCCLFKSRAAYIISNYLEIVADSIYKVHTQLTDNIAHQTDRMWRNI